MTYLWDGLDWAKALPFRVGGAGAMPRLYLDGNPVNDVDVHSIFGHDPFHGLHPSSCQDARGRLNSSATFNLCVTIAVHRSGKLQQVCGMLRFGECHGVEEDAGV